MRRIIFDIETCGYNFEELAESQQEYLMRYVEREKDEDLRTTKAEEAIRYLSLYPYTSKVIAIGMLDVESKRSVVYYESQETEEWVNEEKNIKYIPGSESKIIESFWKIISHCTQVITFNGRNFDIPFITTRSAILKIKPCKNLFTNRYDTKHHIDLIEQLSFYGNVRKFNLDFYCHAFGIESPKAKGISGIDIKTLYDAGKIKEIAVYCSDDIKATYELYNIWNEYMNFEYHHE